MARLTDRPKPGAQPPPRSPFLPPEPRPQLPPADPTLRQRAAASLALGALSLFALLFGGNTNRATYVAAVALVVAAIALVLAISTLSAAKRAGTRRPRGTVAGVVLGVIGFGFSGLVLLAFLIFGTQLNQYRNCLNQANTVAEQQACQNQLNNSVGAQVGILGHK